MPGVREKSLILVTGASGFIATWTCQELLQAGFSVRGTVRSEAKGEYLKELFKEFDDKFSYVIVENIEKKDAFDATMEGVEGVAHISSPIPNHQVEDIYKDIINPAINGTLSVLESAKKHQNIRRVVITSSYGAVVGSHGPDYVYTEKDWNEPSLKILEEQGEKSPVVQAYFASKTLAERSAWNFMKETKLHFDLITLCPSWVFGPVIHQVKSPDELNASLKMIYDYLNGNQLSYFQSAMVDVRDLGLAQLKALITDCAGGERFAISGEPLIFDDFVKILRNYRSEEGKNELPGALLNDIYDASKSKEVLGLQYRPLETTILETIQDFQKLKKNRI